MARIPQYQLDTEITGVEGLLGNDPGQGTAVTKRFNIDDLKSFILEGIAGEDNATAADYVSAIAPDGTGFQQTSLKVVRETNIDHSTNPLALDLGYTVSITVQGNGQVVLLFENPRFEWAFSSFVGATFRAYQATSEGDGVEPIYTGTITSAEQFYYDNDGDTIFPLYVTLDEGQLITSTQVLGINADVGHQLELFGSFDRIKLSVESGLDVAGEVTLSDGMVDIGNPLTQSAEVHIHGDLHFDEAGDRIIFGDGEDPDVVFVSNGNDLNITGGGNIDISDSNDVSIGGSLGLSNDLTITPSGATNSSITIQDDIPGGNPMNNVVITPDSISINGSQVNQVRGNGSGNDAGLLNTIQIGSDLFTIPAPEGAATALPGLNASLSPSTFTGNIGSFFTGTEVASNVLFSTSVSIANSVALSTGDTSFTITDSSDITALNTALSGTLGVFFTEADNSGLSLNDTVPGEVYAITGFNSTTGLATFGLVGGGSLNIATETLNVDSSSVRFNNVPNNNTSGDFLFLDPNNSNRITSGQINVSSSFNSVSYDFGNQTGVDGISSITFEGDHNIDVNTANNPRIDITGRYFFGGELDQDSILLLSPWNTYVLNPITSDSVVSLPASPIVGDSVKIVNLSTVAVSDGAVASTFQWSINAPGSNNAGKIMRQTTNLLLDDPTASFELYYTGGTAGWVITSIN